MFGAVPWYLVHTFCTEEERGLELKKFLIGTGLWMCDNSNAEAFMAVIPGYLRHYGLYLATTLGMKRRGKEMGSTIYTVGADKYDELKLILEKLEGK